jgi:hypothetical protein
LVVTEAELRVSGALMAKLWGDRGELNQLIIKEYSASEPGSHKSC